MVETGKAIIAGTYQWKTGNDIPSVWSEIESIVDGETARKCVDDVKLLEAELKHAKQFGAYASRYAVMEARMWMTIADRTRDIPDARSVFGHAENALIDWILEKDEDGRLYVLGVCAKGKRIDAQRKEDMAIARKMAAPKNYQSCADVIKRDIARNGRTTLNVDRFYDEWSGRTSPNRNTVKAYVEKTRDELLRMGAVGLGDKSGTYVLVGHEYQTPAELSKAILNRIHSISADLERVFDLCRRAGLSIPQKEIKELIRQIESAEVMQS